MPNWIKKRLTLWRAVANLGRAYDSIAADTHDHRANIVHLIDRLAERPSSSGTVKHREPRVFDGRADQVNPFLREINNAVFLQRRSLTSDRDKVVYVSFYLADGAPSSWYRTIELDASRSHLLDNYTSFIDAFKLRFQDSDQYASALRKMRKLKQTSSCAIFTNQYIEILAELDWTEQTKIQEYYDRLKDAVKFTLCNRKGRYFSPNFEEYSRVCIDIDNELHSLSLDTASPRFINVVPPSSPRTSEYSMTDNPFAHRPAAPAPSVSQQSFRLPR